MVTTVTVRLFGVFRALPGAESGAVSVSVPDGASVVDLKHAIAAALPGSNDWLHESVIATESGTLADEAALDGNQAFAVLPPVCGG